MRRTLLVALVSSLAPGLVCLAQEKPDTPVANPTPLAGVAPQPSTDPAAQPAEQSQQQSPAKASFWKRMFTLEAFTATVPGAVIEQIHDWPNQWGRNRFGLGKRVASLYGQFVVGAAIEDGVRALDKEDTAYRRLGEGNFFRRTGHVIRDTLVARQPDDHHTFAFSVAANAYGSWAIATLWSPKELRTPRSIFGWGSVNMGTFALSNFAREFWPDLKGLFRHRPQSGVSSPASR